MLPALATSLLLVAVAASASAGATATTATTTTLTPWCASAMRVRVTPTALPPAAAAAAAALAKSLAAKNMTDLSAALVTTTCTPGAAVRPTPGGAAATNGNLVARLEADGTTLSVSRADTGARLFSAKPSFRFNGAGGQYTKRQHRLPVGFLSTSFRCQHLGCMGRLCVGVGFSFGAGAGAGVSTTRGCGLYAAASTRHVPAMHRAPLTRLRWPSPAASTHEQLHHCHTNPPPPTTLSSGFRCLPVRWLRIAHSPEGCADRPRRTHTHTRTHTGNAPRVPWEEVVNQTVTCAEPEFFGPVSRSQDSAAQCLSAALASGFGNRINYIIYNSGNKGCYMCDMTDRFATTTAHCTPCYPSSPCAIRSKVEDKGCISNCKALPSKGTLKQMWLRVCGVTGRGPYTGPASWGLKAHPGASSWVQRTTLPKPGKVAVIIFGCGFFLRDFVRLTTRAEGPHRGPQHVRGATRNRVDPR